MKRIVRISLCMFLLVLAGACARHKIIPDDTLAQIFHDAFLTNAYIGSEGVKTDSLRIYEPIFARYGYTTDDVHYTIGNFSKRKSARLGDVVERAIEMLEAEGKYYNREVAVYTATLRRNREESFSRRFTTDTTHRRLRIDFLTFNARPERPSVTVTDLKVEYIPPTRTAVEKLYEQQLDIRIFADDFLRAAAIPKDSL